ncbi:MAG TPA: hypothetical protein VFN19_05335 [Candidatus Nanopelagicales bacterium]|nr:hypothetical protein [Candidatus Nanopelagicales bacterium]
MRPGSGQDWDDDDHYPMHPSHPGWDQRSASTIRLRRVVMVLFPVLVGLTGLVLAWRYLAS